MHKFNAGKASILALTAVLAIAAFFLGKTLTKVSASDDGWGDCISSGPQCGTDNGNQSKTVSIQYNTSCPAGYVSNSTDNFDQKCKKVTVTTTDPIFTCPDHYHLQNHGNWDERCHRDDNADHDLKEHTSPTSISCPTGYVKGGIQLDTTCTKTETVYSAPTVSCPESYTKSGSGANTVCSKVLTQHCQTGITQHDSCTPPQNCPETCGYPGSDNQIPNGEGGYRNCPPTNSCSTRRWCFPDEDSPTGFHAEAIPSNETPNTGKPWEPGKMIDANCAYTPAGQCPETCGYQGGTVADGSGGTKECAATKACVTPTPNPDVCPNIPGIQYSFPFNMHLDAAGQNCVNLDQAGPPPNNGNGGGNGPKVLGASTSNQGQVLGASTMAGTGSFAEELYLAIMGLGGTLTTLGFALHKKASKLA